MTSRLSSTSTVPPVESRTKLPLLVSISFAALNPRRILSMCASVKRLSAFPRATDELSTGNTVLETVVMPEI